MECKNVLLLFVFQSITAFSTEEKSISASHSSYFETHGNKQLLGYVVKRFDSPSLLSCGHECLRNSWCTSTNFRLGSSMEEDEGICELNKHNISVINDDTHFAEQEGITFSILLKGCLIEICLNGGSCLPNENQQTFSCFCEKHWTGDRCEIKTAALWNSSCKGIYNKNLGIQNKAYLLQIGNQSIWVYCHMKGLGRCDGNGWTLVMKMNGSKRTFHYDSNLWINKDTLNLEGGKSGFDLQETKLPTYWNTPFTKICLGMKIDGHIRYVAIARQAKSLYSLIADGEYRATSLGRDTWKWLIGSKVLLQPNCNKEGFNVKQTSENRGNLIWPKARIGILGNGQNSCATCDSRIGFGSGGHGDDNNTCGNEAARNSGDTHIKAMGYILVQ